MKYKSFIIFAHIEDGLFWILLQEEGLKCGSMTMLYFILMLK
jgi:hypothetical protein